VHLRIMRPHSMTTTTRSTRISTGFKRRPSITSTLEMLELITMSGVILKEGVVLLKSKRYIFA